MVEVIAGHQADSRGRRIANTIFQRIVANAIVLLIISAVTFALMNFKAPEDLARSVLGREVSSEQIAAFVRSNNLDANFVERYLSWISGVFAGDLGTSLITRRAVSAVVSDAIGRSLTVAMLGAFLGVCSGVLAGVFLGVRVGSKTDIRMVTALLVIASMPEFLIGIALYMLFVTWLGWFPTQAAFAFSFGSASERAMNYILPAATIALLLLPHVARVTRVTMAEAIDAPYVVAAKLRGLSQVQTKWNYAFRSAAASLISVIGVNLVYAISGVVVVEYLFGFPGVGSLLVEAIGAGDSVTVQAVIMIFAIFVIIINVSVDIIIVILNPRLRYGT